MTKNCILLINFNHSRDCNNKEFLKTIYGPYFKSIVFYSDNPPNNDDQINFIDTHKGFYTHRIFDHFFNKHLLDIHNIDGIFYTHDDCIINTKIIHELNLSKIFISDSNILHLDIEKNNICWPHHKESYGLPRVKNLINNPINIIRYGFSDFFYLPIKYFNQDLINMFKLYENVFLEIAIPSIINHIDTDKQLYQELHTTILWQNKRQKLLNENFLQNIMMDSLMVHPIKFNLYPFLKEYISKILL